MLDNITLGRYYLKNSVVHKLNPVFKILSLIIMIISIFFIDSYIDILMLSSYLLLSIVYSDIGIKVYFKNIYSIRIFLIFILLIDLIFFIDINRFIRPFFIRIRPLNKFIPVNDISMIITLTLRYIPTLTMEYNRIIRAQKLRGVQFDTKNIKEKLSSISGVLLPMFVLSLKKAENSADIMDVRLYNYGKSRTNYRLNEWKFIDTLLLILNILILIVVIVY